MAIGQMGSEGYLRPGDVGRNGTSCNGVQYLGQMLDGVDV